MTSRIFLNLRSAAFNPPGDLQTQLATDFPLGSRRAAPMASVQATSGRVPTVGNLDTILFEIASSAEGNALGNLEGLLRRDAP